MSYETLLYSVEDRVANVTINRPDKLNAINAKVKEELGDVMTAVGRATDVDVVILTGAGDKSFVAGTDIAELAGLDGTSGREFAAAGQQLLDRIESLGKPVIAAVNGYALGGGCELALACTLRIASDKARFGQPEVNLGLIPGYGGTQRLARLVGRGRAMEMILTGVQIDAQEALRIGLVNSVVPHADLMPRAALMARLIGSNAQVAVRTALRAVNASVEKTLADGQAYEAGLFGECCATEDFREGISAFLQKRKPAWKGK